MTIYTVDFPLDTTSASELFKTLDEGQINELVKFNIKSTLLTCPGERMSDMSFGACVRQYLFEDLQTLDSEMVRNTIAQQIDTYVPYAVILNLNVGLDFDNHTIKISLRYAIPDIKKQDIFEIILSP
tara:strand:- start:2826 stop:3206 length:381 start_codon:yes stop_codon:yes gene_type:complete